MGLVADHSCQFVHRRAPVQTFHQPASFIDRLFAGTGFIQIIFSVTMQLFFATVEDKLGLAAFAFGVSETTLPAIYFGVGDNLAQGIARQTTEFRIAFIDSFLFEASPVGVAARYFLLGIFFQSRFKFRFQRRLVTLWAWLIRLPN